MQQFASLRQEARDGDLDNESVLQGLQQPPSSTTPGVSEWDVPWADVLNKYGGPSARSKPDPDADQDSLTYYKAAAASKRGEDALVDHVQQKAQKQLKAHDKLAKRQKYDEQDAMEGIKVSERNRRFNDRL